jgi:hypothetical protein
VRLSIRTDRRALLDNIGAINPYLVEIPSGAGHLRCDFSRLSMWDGSNEDDAIRTGHA